MTKYKAGFLIAIEGIDGSGKTTFSNMIRDKLESMGLDVFVLPSGGFHSSEVEAQLRQIAVSENNNIVDTTETLIYFASLAQKVGQYIIPALRENKVVIVDRFVLSTFVISHYMLHQDRQITNELLHFASQGIKPDFTFLCDLDESVAYSRLLSRGKELSKREKKGLPLMSTLRKGFLEEIANTSVHFEIIRTDRILLDEMGAYIDALGQYFL